MRDRTDRDLEQTALREAEEEIGLTGEDVEEVVGRLDWVTSRARIRVTPVVVRVRAGFRPTPRSGEVASAFSMPLKTLVSTASHSDFVWDPPDGAPPLLLHVFEHRGFKVWGLTAAIGIHAASVALATRPPFRLLAPWESEREGEREAQGPRAKL